MDRGPHQAPGLLCPWDREAADTAEQLSPAQHRVVRSTETESRWWGPGAWGRGTVGVSSGNRVSVLQHGKRFGDWLRNTVNIPSATELKSGLDGTFYVIYIFLAQFLKIHHFKGSKSVTAQSHVVQAPYLSSSRTFPSCPKGDPSPLAAPHPPSPSPR